MTKKDFIALADTIKSFDADHIGRAHYKDSPCFSQDQVNALADFCAAQNPRFDRGRWLAYVNGEQNGGKR